MTQSTSPAISALATIGLSIAEAKGQPHTPAAQLRVTRNGIEGDHHAGPVPREHAGATEPDPQRTPGNDGNTFGKLHAKILWKKDACESRLARLYIKYSLVSALCDPSFPTEILWPRCGFGRRPFPPIA